MYFNPLCLHTVTAFIKTFTLYTMYTIKEEDQPGTIAS